MNIVIEVVATNMDTGHVAISQETVLVGENMPVRKQIEYADRIKKMLEDREVLKAHKVGPILIKRSVIILGN